MAQAEAQATIILAFPTTRTHPYPQGYVPSSKLPPNAVRLYERVSDQEIVYRPLPPSGYLIHALLEALEDRRPGRRRIDKTLDALVAMMRRFEDDPAVRQSVGQAVNMLCSTMSGRMAV